MRAWPAGILTRMMRMNVERGYPLVLYVHPGNLDDGKQRLGSLTLRDKASQYLWSRRGLYSMRCILSEFKFGTVSDMFGNELNLPRS